MSTVLVLLSAVARADEPAADEASAVDSPFALSIGTGPRPLNTLTAGLTGLAARGMFPLGRAIPWVGLSVNSVSVASFEDGNRSDRFVSGASAVHGSLGVRVDLDERRPKAVVPYLLAGALVGNAGTRGGSPADDNWFKTGVFTTGLLAGVGLDGFVTRHVSLGAELGGLGALSGIGSRDIDDGDVDERGDEKVSTTVLSTFTALQVTVWR